MVVVVVVVVAVAVAVAVIIINIILVDIVAAVINFGHHHARINRHRHGEISRGPVDF